MKIEVLAVQAALLPVEWTDKLRLRIALFSGCVWVGA